MAPGTVTHTVTSDCHTDTLQLTCVAPDLVRVTSVTVGTKAAVGSQAAEGNQAAAGSPGEVGTGAPVDSLAAEVKSCSVTNHTSQYATCVNNQALDRIAQRSVATV